MIEIHSTEILINDNNQRRRPLCVGIADANPNLGWWCYGEEDYIGTRISKL